MAHLEDRIGAIAIRGRFTPELLQRFRTWVETAPDEALFRINPVQFASSFGVSENEAIDLFVHAAHAGIFDLAWGKVCGLCGAYLTRPEGMRATGEELPCAPCETTVAGSLDDDVEATFTISESIRHIRFHDEEVRDQRDFFHAYVAPSARPSQEYTDFINDWWITPITLGPSATVVSDLDLDEGEYTFFTFDAHVASKIFVKAGAPTRAEIDIFD
ncbi:MAG TPA: DUF5939 domain-containing protein, partial [bacterium]|nr:DUF5939 domain-containing protein [bacterium]